MTLKVRMETANAILEKLNKMKPGEYMALPEDGLVKLMLKTGDKKMVMYIDPEGLIEQFAETILEKL